MCVVKARCIGWPTDFFFNDAATTEIYTLSLHDALPISGQAGEVVGNGRGIGEQAVERDRGAELAAQRLDRKSTRLNSSHANISYAVFCLKKNTTPHLTLRPSCPLSCLTIFPSAPLAYSD